SCTCPVKYYLLPRNYNHRNRAFLRAVNNLEASCQIDKNTTASIVKSNHRHSFKEHTLRTLKYIRWLQINSLQRNRPNRPASNGTIRRVFTKPHVSHYATLSWIRKIADYILDIRIVDCFDFNGATRTHKIPLGYNSANLFSICCKRHKKCTNN